MLHLDYSSRCSLCIIGAGKFHILEIQSKALQKMANNSQQVKKSNGISTEKTIQGYFTLYDKKTNNKTEFPDI